MTKTESSHQKNDYKKLVKSMTYQQLLKEYNEIVFVKMKIDIMRSKGISAVGTFNSPGFPVKFVKWKHAYISSKLSEKKNGQQ